MAIIQETELEQNSQPKSYGKKTINFNRNPETASQQHAHNKNKQYIISVLHFYSLYSYKFYRMLRNLVYFHK